MSEQLRITGKGELRSLVSQLRGLQKKGVLSDNEFNLGLSAAAQVRNELEVTIGVEKSLTTLPKLTFDESNLLFNELYNLRKNTLLENDDLSPTDNNLLRIHQIRETLIKGYSSYAAYLARRVNTNTIDIEEKTAIGMEGLIRAVDSYDPTKGSFSQYAAQRIQGFVIDEARRQMFESRTSHNHRMEIRNAEIEYYTKFGHLPSDEELSEHSGIKKSILREYRTAPSVKSLENFFAQSENKNNVGYHERLPDTTDVEGDFLENQDNEEKRSLLKKMFGQMDDRWVRILKLYYAENMTMKEISEILNVSETRVSQIHKEAINKLRKGFDLAT